MGVDIGYDQKQLFVSQETFIETKLPVIDIQKFFVAPDKLIPLSQRLTECKRVVGNLIWAIQTRPDIAYKLRSMSSQVVEIVKMIKVLPNGCAMRRN